MEFSIKNDNPEKLHSDCVIIGVYESQKLSNAALALDIASAGYLSNILKRGDMDGKADTTLMLHNVPGVASERMLLVGLGKESEFSEKQYCKAIRASVKALSNGGASKAATFLAELPVKQLSAKRKVALMAETTLDAAYRFDAIKRKKDESKKEEAKKGIATLYINVALASEVKEAKAGLADGLALASGVSFAKDLGNLPPNVCTPTYLAEQAQTLGKKHDFKVKILEREELKKLGMGSFLAVSQGSEEPPKFIIMQHLKGKKDQKPVVLVGKGITFDTGGISLKPGAEMDEMKYDMCGAASVLGTFKTISEMDLALNVIGIIPTCENMPDGRATRPGDVLTSMSGLTIEVLNTDAEGRLILCDALTYAERFEPSAVVDVATLTGACVIALGHHATGLFSNNDDLANELLKAGEASLDRAWHMPMWDDYQPLLDSNFADIANIGGRAAGSITAACFLSRFAKKYDWAHLDIAGTAWKSGKEKGGTGRPVPLLTEFLVNRANSSKK
ncbi:leucyl aminopeptidase [Methylotenera sp.]|uniref:leucyl aminopeptidase n=3 Tax=Methylotenera sp. TaxID=2051956 RepID=UPI0027300184|nr:leucyl aminopeptidase [Methylotenera sp.]MDP1523832.1 leucyl aminopeptidase [Methylotenera sp.]MDP2070222.1 leucyl aminopeptidase [Methylotenera sp.]MDP3007392.1 leucyl aminopeptidase [Methylotenera sp.]